MRKQIPNILTLANLFSGCIAIYMAFQGNTKAVVGWVVMAALFDFFDGLAARALNAFSPLGKELDSLADVVSFGVAPATAVFVLLQELSFNSGYTETLLHGYPHFAFLINLPFLAFLIPVFSAYRLAKFNIDDRQTSSFLGLPVPANGLFWVSYCYGIGEGIHRMELFSDCSFYLILTLILILLMSLLMVSNIPMFSLKIKKMAFKGNERQSVLVLLFMLLVAFLGISGVAWGIVAYILLSVLWRSKQQTNR